MRKSFILHLDSLCILDDLTDEQRGQLFNSIYKFNIGEEIKLTGMLKIAFSPFRNQFLRDIEKYDVFCESQRKRRLGKGKNQTEPNKPTVTKETNGTNSVSVSVSKSVSDIKKKKKQYSDFNNVLLLDSEFEKIKEKFNDYEKKINNLGEYMKMKGASYKDHYLTILNWARRDEEKSGTSQKKREFVSYN